MKTTSTTLALLLILNLVLTPLSTVYAQRSTTDRSYVSPFLRDDYENSSESSSNSDNGESEEEKDQRLADETAAEIRDAASAAGISLTVDSVYGSSPSGSSVSVNGISISKEAALSAISALSSAKDAGSLSAVDTNKTLAAYGGGGMCSGCVVGLYTAVTGPVSRVAEAEANYLIERNRVGSLRNVGGAAVPARNLTAAIDVVAPKLLSTDNTKSLTPQNQQSSVRVIPTANYIGNTDERGYIYDPETDTLIGLTTGKTYDIRDNQIAADVPRIAASNPDSVIKFDTKRGLISATETKTGIVKSYVTPGSDISLAMSWDGTSYGTYELISDNKDGFKMVDATNGTPSSWVVSGELNLGRPNNTVQNKASQYGLSVTSGEDVAALALAGELSPAARQAIKKAYAEDPTFKTLDTSHIREAGGLLGSFAGEAYRTGKSLSDQLLKNDYITSITVDNKAYINLANNFDAMSAFAKSLTNGQLTNQYGLKVTAPVAVANHTYASTLDPDNPSNRLHKVSESTRAWIEEMNENATRVGGKHYTEVGYISSEIASPQSGWNTLIVRDEDFVYDTATYGQFDSKLYTLAVAVPQKPSAGVVIGNNSNVSLSTNPVTSITTTGGGSSNTSQGQPGSSNTGQSNNNASQAQTTGVTTKSLTHHQGTNMLDTSRVSLKPEVSLAGVRESTIAEINRLAQECNCKFLLNSVTDGSHSPTGNSHAKGYKFDVGSWDTASGDRNKPSAFTEHMLNPSNGWTKTTPVTHRDGSKHDAYIHPNHPGVKAVLEHAGVPGSEHWDIQVNQNVSPSSGGSTVTPNPENKQNGSSNGWLSGAIKTVKDAVTSNETVASITENVNNTLNNPFVKLYLWANGTFRGGTGTFNDNYDNNGTSGNNNGSDNPTNTIPPCPSNPNATDPYRDWRIQNGYPPCVATSTPSSSGQQAGASILAFLENNFFKNILGFFGKKESRDDDLPVENTRPDEENQAIVKITIDDYNDLIILSRPDLEAVVADPEIDESIRNSFLEKFSEVPIIFDENGGIVYSNGLYNPPVENGHELGTKEVYSYIIEYVDSNGNPIAQEGGSNVPGNLIADTLRSIIGGTQPFSLSDIEEVTYYLIDPNKTIPNDEYYRYTIKLLNGRNRSVDIPQFTSVNNMEVQFGKIGYNEDVIALISLATEYQPEPTLAEKISQTITNLYEKFVDVIKNDYSNTDQNNDTRLPEISNDIKVSDISSVTIYPNSTATCPEAAGVTQGFMYVAVLTDRANPQKYTTITDGRCGVTDPITMIAETARHLNEYYGIVDVSYESIASNTTIRPEVTVFIPGVDTLTLKTSAPPLPEPEPTPTTTTQLPNLTNTIKFEVKAVGSDGRVLADWVDTEKITISPTVQLQFRWEANDYQQCLPFLNDNGNYSLTRSNRAMITGNTENENYNVTRRTGVYRIECGGQRNNEFGVDFREIEVVVN